MARQHPKWVMPDRQALLVRLFVRSKGFCVYGHSPCTGELQTETLTACAWGKPCTHPMPDGELCRYKPEDDKPHLPCEYVTRTRYVWRCAYGVTSCQFPYGSHYEPYTDRLIREWVFTDKAQRQAEWRAERQALHRLADRREPVHGQFNATSRDIFYASQPTYYYEGVGMSGLTLRPFARIRLASSYLELFVDLGDTLRPLSKAKRRKALRYGKSLPVEVQRQVDKLCKLAVRHHQHK